jgi:hypothetical protein
MKTELKDVIHLYIGCDALCESVTDSPEPNIQQIFGYDSTIKMINFGHGDAKTLDEFKPILRPLSDLKESDLDLGGLLTAFTIKKDEYSKSYSMIIEDENDGSGFHLTIDSDGSIHCLCKDNHESYSYNGSKIFLSLLKNGIDLFGLVESKQAVDKTQLK